MEKGKAFWPIKEKSASFRFLSCLCLSLVLPLFSQEEKTRKEQPEKAPPITEEIIVTGERPRETLVSSVTIIESGVLERRRLKDLAEAVKTAPGVYVSFGEKNEFTLKLRGMDSRRIALFLDGVPSSEPFFGSFDLKTIEVASVQSIQITRGPASVLYGPNTLGGIVNVISRRPSPDPELTFHATYGENRSRSLGFLASQSWKKLAASTSFLFQDSAKFYYSDGNNRLSRENSDYRRLSFNAKLFYTPTHDTEVLIQGSLFSSSFGLPPSLTSARPRYWRFKDWDRVMLSAGGFTSLGDETTLRFRAYTIAYENVLDSYTDGSMKHLAFQSTFDNAVHGLFSLLDIPLGPGHTVKTSLTLQHEIARTQDDRGASWQVYRQRVLAMAGEDYLFLSPSWLLIAGASLEHLRKHEGSSTFRISPLVGLKFSPEESWEIHFSFSRKSRFPSMRSLYAPSFGNPHLTPEAGHLWEFGFTRQGTLLTLSGAIFFNRLEGMIESLRLPDGSRLFYNVSRASIDGLEILAVNSSASFQASLSYTYLRHRNRTEKRPLDALPGHNLSFDFSLLLASKLRATFTGRLASSSTWFDVGSGSLLTIPGYFDLAGVVAGIFSGFEVFIKATNLLNQDCFTEPGFPCPARTFEVGFKVKLF